MTARARGKLCQGCFESVFHVHQRLKSANLIGNERFERALEIDPALIGGAVIRAEDMVIDDSLRARLTRLAGALVD